VRPIEAQGFLEGHNAAGAVYCGKAWAQKKD
jgi:hypothetical protein